MFHRSLCALFAFFAVAFLLGLGLTACDDGDDPSTSSGQAQSDDDDASDDDEGADDDASPEIDWTDCPSYIAGYVFEGQEAKCAEIAMPLDYDDPKGQTIDIFIFKVGYPSDEPKDGALWLLEGGPGGPGEDFAPLMPWLAEDYPDLDIYSLDHRGVGNSTKLTCPMEDSYPFAYELCAQSLEEQWGDGLRQFTTSNAARDLGAAIDLLSPDYPDVFVYGASYGTYWAIRYLDLFPTQPTGVILDSICPPGACKLDIYDQNFNDNGHLIMDACADDSTCAAKLGVIDADPWTAVGKAFDAVDAGTLCPELGLDRLTVRNVLGMLEMDSLARVVVPALVYRAMRCNADDVTAIDNLFDAYFGGKGALATGDYLDDFYDLDASTTLGTLVLLSELWDFTPYEQLMEIVNSAYFSIDLGSWMGEISDWGQWPTYPDDGHFGEWPQSDKPVLMLNGTLDPQTTLAMAQPAGEHLTAAHQTFVTMPYSAHGVIFQSYTSASVDLLVANQDGYVMETCGMNLMYQFLDDPTATLDTSCLDDLNPLEFSADSPLNQWISELLLGTTDMYEGVPAAGKRAPAVWPFRAPHRGPLAMR